MFFVAPGCVRVGGRPWCHRLASRLVAVVPGAHSVPASTLRSREDRRHDRPTDALPELVTPLSPIAGQRPRYRAFRRRRAVTSALEPGASGILVERTGRVGPAPACVRLSA